MKVYLLFSFLVPGGIASAQYAGTLQEHMKAQGVQPLPTATPAQKGAKAAATMSRAMSATTEQSAPGQTK